MIKGNVKKHKGVGYVCYLDILGFSVDILNNWNNSNVNPLQTILNIKKNLPIINPHETSLNIKNEEKREYVSRVSSISDSITVSFGLDENHILGDRLLGLISIMVNIKHIWSGLIMKGYTVRGAIDYGDIYWDEIEIIGPAFINAYRLESNVTKTSRVVISSDLNAVIKELSERLGSEIQSIFLNHFMKDIDGYITFNPDLLYDSEIEREKLIENLKKQRSKVKDKIIKEKYTPLINIL